ncbi:peroxisomal membrane protein PEX13-like [Anopheles marshallii]|uniref:peroxisomal membrane protein PEX13-like n=1 Tax=Anopheles marshallii TaxID=1521116 RepID=UPI00237B7135|nr:peroxisomal membrane protein PEX13-like [Anopheles marshallii]
MATNFRNTTLNEERIFGNTSGLNTSGGLISTSHPPPLPPRPQFSGGGGDMMFGNRYGFAGQPGYPGYNPYGGYSSMDYYGARSYGGGYMGQGYGGYGSGGYGGFNNPEHRFIQLAEESSRPAFQILESLVGAVGNVAMMLDSTFFAVTSSFRAVLSVAANLAHLKGTFAQFWSSLAIVRAAVWLYKKLLYKLRITKTDPTIEAFREAFNGSANSEVTGNSTRKHSSSLLAALFMGFMLSVPYMLIKLFAPKVTADTALNDPAQWSDPVEVQVLHKFDASNAQEMSIRTGQIVLLAPKEIQTDRHLLNTGWVLAASADRKSCGIIPLNYVQALKQSVERQ